jgi:hypothetical protein
VREREREREDTTPVVMELKLHSNLVAISDGFVLQLPVPYNKRTTYSRTSSHNEDFMNKLNPAPPMHTMKFSSAQGVIAQWCSSSFKGLEFKPVDV